MAQSILGVTHTAPIVEVGAGACDCHVHVFGSHMEYPFAKDRVYMPSVAAVSDLAALNKSLKLSRVVVVQASPQGTDNRCLVAALKELGNRGVQARGVAVVDDFIRPEELDDLHRAGVRGVRVNLESFGQRDSAVAERSLRAADRLAAALGWHVQVYTNLRVIGRMADAIDSMSTPLVVDHFALADATAGLDQEGMKEALELVRRGRIYVKLSAPYRIIRRADAEDGKRIARAFIEARLDRMLWGTDWPHTGAWPGKPRMKAEPEPFHPIDDGQQFNIFCGWTSAVERQAILIDNPQKLYDFGHPKPVSAGTPG